VPDPNINVTLPSVLPHGNAPAVIKVDYLCPELRIKSPGSLITSVFVGEHPLSPMTQLENRLSILNDRDVEYVHGVVRRLSVYWSYARETV
jgi:hypothetical protein